MAAAGISSAEGIATLLQTCLAPNVPQDARQLAHLQLEQFKQRPDVLELSLELFFAEANRPPQQPVPPREFVLHFALRTCVTLVRQFYALFPPDKSLLLKTSLLAMLDHPHAASSSRLVESTIIVLGVEILKQDANHVKLFADLISRLNTSASAASPASSTASKILCDFSESLFEDEDDVVLTTVRRSVLTKYLNAPFALQVLPIALLQVEYELSVLNNEKHMAQSLRLASECLRWNPPLQQNNSSVERNALALFERCCENVNFPPAVIQAAYVCVKHYAWCGKINLLPTAYSLVHKHIVSRAPAQFHSQEEFQLANDVFITLVQRHHADLPPKSVQWQRDLEHMTTTCSTSTTPMVLNDYLGLWKDLIAASASASNHKKPSLVLTHSWIVTLVKLCVVADHPPDAGVGGEDEDDGDHEPFESQKPLLLKELVRAHFDSTVEIVLDALASLSPQQQWFLVESVSNGMTDKQLELVKRGSSNTGGNGNNKLVALAERVLEWVLAKRPNTAAELKVLHSAHALFETRTAFLSKALQYYVDVAVDSQLASPFKKRAACHLLDTLRKSKLTQDLFVLPSLVQRVSQVFPSLVGAEKFVLLECILVAGHALPTEAERIELTRQVLAEPFQTLNETGPAVLQHRFLAMSASPTAAAGSAATAKPWDQRGYLVDVEYLPAESKRFIVALMTISTCAKDGQLTEQMWQQLLPIAVACLGELDRMWCEQPRPELLVVHPVDVRMLFGSRVAETMEMFMEGLVEFGQRVLRMEGMAVCTLVSCVRTCCLELVKEVQVKFPQLVTPATVRQLFQQCDQIEHRHLAQLLSAVVQAPTLPTAERVFLNQICQHVAMQRLAASSTTAPASWQVRIPPTCQEFVSEVNAAARRLLELAFCRFVAALPVEAYVDQQFQWLLERIAFAQDDQQQVRLAVGAVMERYMSKVSDDALAKLAVPACVQAYAVHVDTSKMLVGEVFADAVCRLVYRIPCKDFHVRTKPKKGGGGGGKQGGGAPQVALLQACFPGNSGNLVSRFVTDVDAHATSEKTFRQCAVDLLKSTLAPTAEAKTSGGQQQANANSSSKKKKGKKGKKGSTPPPPPTGTGEDGSAAAAAAVVPPWHLASDSRDLGMQALFADDDDDL